LGFCNFYQCFIKDYAKIAKSLNRLTWRDIPFNFDSAYRKAFELLKKKLVEAPILRHYDPTKRARVESDALEGVIAAVFSQE
jgi:hypothetical protein